MRSTFTSHCRKPVRLLCGFRAFRIRAYFMGFVSHLHDPNLDTSNDPKQHDTSSLLVPASRQSTLVCSSIPLACSERWPWIYRIQSFCNNSLDYSGDGLVVSTTLLKCRLLHINRDPLAERFFDAEDWGGCLPVTSPRKPWMSAKFTSRCRRPGQQTSVCERSVRTARARFRTQRLLLARAMREKSLSS